jgi:hypothetical protein
MSNTNESMDADFLYEDPTISSQKWGLISFADPPGNILAKKEEFYFRKFLKSVTQKYDVDEAIIGEYENFKYKYHENLQTDFNKEIKYNHNIGGVKIRGNYEAKEIAERKAEGLRRLEPAFHVFVCEVGKWLEHSPNADFINEEVYQERGLNDLIKGVNENNLQKDVFFQDRVAEMKEDAIKNNEKKVNFTEKDVEVIEIGEHNASVNINQSEENSTEENSTEKIQVLENDSESEKNLKNIVNNIFN